MSKTRITGAALAFAAASLFATALPTAAAGGATDSAVHCYGINSCKGHNDCKTDKNACKGMGSCKGMGFVEKGSATECTQAGGTVGK